MSFTTLGLAFVGGHESNDSLYCLDPESADWQLIVELTGSDPRLFQVLLSRKHMSRFHFAPLAGKPTEVWCEMACMALDAGYTPDEVAKAAFSWTWSWNGEESAMWNQQAREFENLLDHRDTRLRAVARVGIEIAREREQYAIADERREKVYGLRRLNRDGV